MRNYGSDTRIIILSLNKKNETGRNLARRIMKKN